MNPNGEEVIDAAGYNTFIFESSQANIQLLSDESYKENNTLFKHCMEKDLVHELLHCKYDWMGCQGGTYNNEVRAYKKYVRKFPHKQILGVMGYEVINYDYLEYSEEDRQPVSNLFGE